MRTMTQPLERPTQAQERRELLQLALRNAGRAGKPIVLACSALKGSYRDNLNVHDGVRFVFLDAPAALGP